MNTLYNKRILLGISGSIAAYKSAEITRRLRELGAEVKVVMTRSSMAFITPLTMQALSGNPVHSELMDTTAEAAMGHIELARWPDLILLAPASADLISRLACGRADELLSAICLASQTQIAVAPAMNQGMWQNTATQDNIKTLKQRDFNLFGPSQGLQACGETGPGRLLEPAQIVAECASLFSSGQLTGKHVLITAGPTREPIDPVRYISNRSSGKMGFAIARACVEAGAKVTLVAGPVQQVTPKGVDRIDVETAQQMYQAVHRQLSPCDIFIATAAVADYKPGIQAVNKIKKTAREMQLKMVRTHDILSSVAALSPSPFTVGFAAETDHVEAYARTKLENKKLDIIVANAVSSTKGFDQDDNEMDILWSQGQLHLERNSKTVLAQKLIKIIAERINANNTAKNTGRKTR